MVGSLPIEFDYSMIFFNQTASNYTYTYRLRCGKGHHWHLLISLLTSTLRTFQTVGILENLTYILILQIFDRLFHQKEGYNPSHKRDDRTYDTNVEEEDVGKSVPTRSVLFTLNSITY